MALILFPKKGSTVSYRQIISNLRKALTFSLHRIQSLVKQHYGNVLAKNFSSDIR